MRWWSEVTARRIGIGIGAARTGIGLWMLTTPSSLPRTFGAAPHVGPEASWVTRMVGWREVALGGGSALALSRGEPPVLWLLGQAVVDTGDALAFWAAGRAGLIPPGKALPAALQALSWAGLLAAAARTLRPAGR